ncbi:MAG TPA: phage holin family protein, partial [Allosphingosinicella sp.]
PAVLKRVEVTPPDYEPRDESIGELFSRLVEDGRAYARAELDLVKQIARHRAAKAKTGAILLGVGVTLLLCSLTALVLALVLGLATLIGPFGAGMAVFIVLAVAGGLLARAGAKGLASLGGDDEEKAALAKAEQLP